MEEKMVACDDLHAFWDQQLPPELAAEFRPHLAVCRRCATESLDLMALDALIERYREARNRPWRRLWRWLRRER